MKGTQPFKRELVQQSLMLAQYCYQHTNSTVQTLEKTLNDQLDDHVPFTGRDD